jgi:hypothetical protein
MSAKLKYGEFYKVPNKHGIGFDYYPVGVDDKTMPLYNTMERVIGFGVSLLGQSWEFFDDLTKCQNYIDHFYPLAILPVEQ